MIPALTALGDDDLRMLLTIRHFETALLELFGKGQLSGTTHTCIGQEAVPVALRPLLREDDFVFSNHRGHGHHLCVFDDPAGLLAEIMGREGAICGGVGGSQHLHHPGRYLSTGVQGETLPVATGVALHMKRAGGGRIALAYIGDGTMGEGAVYEALNVAQLWKLPLVVVVENNHISQTTPLSLNLAGSIEARARAFGLRYIHVRTNDVAAIRAAVEEDVRSTRVDPRPLFLECETDRLGPHSKGDDTRDAAELAELRARDWYPRYRAAFAEQHERVEAQVVARLAAVRQEVEARPLSRWAPS